MLSTYARIAHERGRHGTEWRALLHRGEHVGHAEQQVRSIVRDLLTESTAAGAVVLPRPTRRSSPTTASTLSRPPAAPPRTPPWTVSSASPWPACAHREEPICSSASARARANPVHGERVSSSGYLWFAENSSSQDEVENSPARAHRCRAGTTRRHEQADESAWLSLGMRCRLARTTAPRRACIPIERHECQIAHQRGRDLGRQHGAGAAITRRGNGPTSAR